CPTTSQRSPPVVVRRPVDPAPGPYQDHQRVVDVGRRLSSPAGCLSVKLSRSAIVAGVASAIPLAAIGPPPDARAPASPWTSAAIAPASIAPTPEAISVPAMPASTSPDPAVASHDGPSLWLSRCPAGLAMSV